MKTILNRLSASAAGKSNRTLSPRVAELLDERQGNLPVWIRSPKRGTEHYTGLSRSKLYDAAGKGLIRTVSIREPGQTKGSRLFHLASILNYIETCESEASFRQEGAA